MSFTFLRHLSRKGKWKVASQAIATRRSLTMLPRCQPGGLRRLRVLRATKIQTSSAHRPTLTESRKCVRCPGGIRNALIVLECGGKRSATPLSHARKSFASVYFPSAKKRRRRSRSADAVQNRPFQTVYRKRAVKCGRAGAEWLNNKATKEQGFSGLVAWFLRCSKCFRTKSSAAARKPKNHANSAKMVKNKVFFAPYWLADRPNDLADTLY